MKLSRKEQQEKLHRRAVNAAHEGNQLALEEVGAGSLRVNYGSGCFDDFLNLRGLESPCSLCPCNSSQSVNTAWLCTIIAACHGHLHILKWAKMNQLNWDQETFQAAFEAAAQDGVHPNYSLRHRYVTTHLIKCTCIWQSAQGKMVQDCKQSQSVVPWLPCFSLSSQA